MSAHISFDICIFCSGRFLRTARVTTFLCVWVLLSKTASSVRVKNRVGFGVKEQKHM